TSCEKDETTENDYGTLKGSIGLYEGNRMPGAGVTPCQPSPVSTTVAITIPSENFDPHLLIDSVITSDNGTFEANLPEGSYSLFLRDGNDFICDSRTCPSDCFCTYFKITRDSVTTVSANIDHAAW
ncbi:MAG: hypothetical protein PVF73_08475, partial [Bacteroidales bacterium]